MFNQSVGVEEEAASCASQEAYYLGPQEPGPTTWFPTKNQDQEPGPGLPIYQELELFSPQGGQLQGQPPQGKKAPLTASCGVGWECPP